MALKLASATNTQTESINLLTQRIFLHDWPHTQENGTRPVAELNEKSEGYFTFGGPLSHDFVVAMNKSLDGGIFEVYKGRCSLRVETPELQVMV